MPIFVQLWHCRYRFTSSDWDMQRDDSIIVPTSLSRLYRKLLKSSRTFLTREDTAYIRKAFYLVWNHSGKTSYGEEMVARSLEVAVICASELGLRSTSIVSCILFPLVGCKELTCDEIRKEFGDKVADISSSLALITEMETKANQNQGENFRKLLFSVVEDIRVILIKLAERLHAMRTLSAKEAAEERVRFSLETFQLYAPLGHRLGLYTLKSELEDLALKHTQPEAYATIERKLAETTSSRNRVIREFIHPIREELARLGFDFEIKGRLKSIFSIYNKMRKQNIDFEEVFDLFAIRIILNSPAETEKSDCWRVFSVVTDFYQPNPLRMRDWISVPKSNGYESLHTTVVMTGGRWVEVQIRTARMNEIAEKGLAAHWKYKGGHSDQGLETWLAKIREVVETPDPDAHAFMDNVKLNLYAKEVFVFTPTGDLKQLPAGATVLDFAFEVHSRLGASCTGAKVNGKVVPIRYVLQNGDKVEILSAKSQKPKKDWLSIAVTSKAKGRIRAYLREEEKKNSELGKEELQRRFKNWKIALDDAALLKIMKFLKAKSVTEVYGLVAENRIDPLILKELFADKPDREEASKQPERIDEQAVSNLIKTPVYEQAHDYLLIDENISNVNYKLSPCCNPIFGDPIFGFVTIHDGIKVHRTNCPNAKQLMEKFGYRVVKTRWAKSDGKALYPVELLITGINDIGLISRITDEMGHDSTVSMRSINVRTEGQLFEGNLSLLVSDIQHLDNLIARLKKIKGIINVSRN